jgi:hypothetical protein
MHPGEAPRFARLCAICVADSRKLLGQKRGDCRVQQAAIGAGRGFKCSYLDLHPLLCDAKGELKEDFTKDGLHLTEPAYLIWREQILKALHWD